MSMNELSPMLPLSNQPQEPGLRVGSPEFLAAVQKGREKANGFFVDPNSQILPPQDPLNQVVKTDTEAPAPATIGSRAITGTTLRDVVSKVTDVAETATRDFGGLSTGAQRRDDEARISEALEAARRRSQRP